MMYGLKPVPFRQKPALFKLKSAPFKLCGYGLVSVLVSGCWFSPKIFFPRVFLACISFVEQERGTTMNVQISTLELSQVITAVGGLGTAAFGLLEALKPFFSSINRMGLDHISDTIATLTPTQNGEGVPRDPLNAPPQRSILATIEANWVNGVDLTAQKAVAKALIKLHLSPGTAEAVAKNVNIDPVVLNAVAAKTLAGLPLAQPESDVFSRFDLMITSMLDEAYQYSDQVYRNRTRTLAAFLAVVLALCGAIGLEGRILFQPGHLHDLALALLVGILATPLAPIAKDISTALTTAVNTMQVVKRVIPR